MSEPLFTPTALQQVQDRLMAAVAARDVVPPAAAPEQEPLVD